MRYKLLALIMAVPVLVSTTASAVGVDEKLSTTVELVEQDVDDKINDIAYEKRLNST